MEREPEILFMIHGMCCGSWAWENYVNFFQEKGYTCVAPTLRHHDMNPNDEPNPLLGTTSLLDYADDLEKEIQALGTKPVIIGHSMGGLLAQILGSRNLGKSLVLLTSAPPTGIVALSFSVLRCFWTAMTKWAFWRKPFRFTFDEAAYGIFNKCPQEEQRSLYSRFVFESGRAASEIVFWLFDSQGTARVDETKITCPMLMIAAGDDRITPASIGKKMREKYKAVCTYQEYPGQGHWVLGEPGWESIAEDVVKWLR
jgi:non-heme chloroperoxidase